MKKPAPAFFYLATPEMAIDPARPWQLLSAMGCVLGKFSTPEKAQSALDAIIADHNAGTLPCNLSTWDKKHLLED